MSAPTFPLRPQAPLLLGSAAAAALAAIEAVLHTAQAVPVPSLPRTYGVAFLPAFWEALSAAGYGAYAVPFMTARSAGELRRLAAGFAALLAFGAGAALSGAGAALACLHIAALAYACLALAERLRQAPAWAACAGAALAAAGIAAVLARGHDAGEVAMGAAAGATAWAFAFGGCLGFLDSDRPGTRMLFQIRNLAAILTGRRSAAWDEDYSAGHWDFLDSMAQRARHHAIAGAIRDRFPEGARVLDLGCGLGTLFEALRGAVGQYRGVDMSEAAVGACRRRFAAEPAAAFQAADIEAYRTGQAFDAVVLNEVLYYLPSRRAVAAFQGALALAASGGGVLVVSMNRGIKSRLLWRLFDTVARPEQSLRVENLESGSWWTVRVYRGAVTARRSETAVMERPSRLRQAAIAAAMALVFGVGFYATGWHMEGQAAAGWSFWIPAAAADAWVPFLPAWGWVYLLYFPFCLLPLAFRGVRDDAAEFRRVAAGFAAQFAAAIAFFWLVPSRVLRPALGGVTWLEAPLAAVFDADPGFNAFPSLHVANVVFVALLARRHGGPPWGAAAAVAAGLVAASTLFVKQHYLADAAAGAALGWAAFRGAFRRVTTHMEVMR